MKRLNIKTLGISLAMIAAVLDGCQTKNESANETPENIEYELVEDWPQLPAGYQVGQPTGIGIDSEGHIFVFHRASRRWTNPFPDSLISENTILELENETGKLVNSWGANSFIMPHGLTVDQDNNIWLTDVGLHQVFKFSHDGQLLMTLGVAKTPGTDSLHFNLPTDVAIAKDGSFYVSDGYGNSRVVKFSPSGNYLYEWGTFGEQEGQFNIPHGITLDDEGSVYVADRQNNRIQKFDSTGVFLKEIKNNEEVAQIPSVTIDEKQNLYAIDYDFADTVIKGSTVFQYGTDDQVAFKFGGIGTTARTPSWYHDISVDRSGNIYVGDIYGIKIRKFRIKPVGKN